MHPAARILTDIARSQDAEVGDGTTSVVVLAGEILKEVRDLVEQGVSSQTIIKGLRRASAMAVNKIKEIAVEMINSAESEEKKIETLRRLAGTAMNSKLIKRNQEFFTKSEDPSTRTLCGLGELEMADSVIFNSGCRRGAHPGPGRLEREVDWCEEGYWWWSSGVPFRQRCRFQEDILLRWFRAAAQVLQGP